MNVFKVVKKEKGLAAEQVECDRCAEPEQWEMRPTGEPVFGVYELEPVCINKPYGYKNRPMFDVIRAANEPFERAQAKQRRWDSSLSQKFFEEFGEPQRIGIFDGNHLILKYQHGDKKVWMSEAMDSEYWQVLPSGHWRQTGYAVEAEFIFDEIPDAKVWRAAASFMPHPRLEKQFDLLPPAVQEKILRAVREQVLPPATVAAERFQAFLSDESSQKRITEIRDDIIALQAPGESVVHSKRSRHQEETMGHYGSESWGTGHYMDVQTVLYYLTTGVRKGRKNNSDWRYSPKGVKTFSINAPATNETDEDVRNKLLAEKKQALQAQFKRAKEIDPPAPDPRFYTLAPEQWTEQYNQKWEEIQAQTEAKWQAEDKQKLAEMHSQYEAYEKDLAEIRKDMEILQAIIGKSPYFEFRKNYSASLSRAEELSEQLSKALAKLEQDYPGLSGVMPVAPQEAKAIAEEVRGAIESQKLIAEARGYEEERLKPLLAEVEALAGQKLGRRNAWQYGIEYEEQESLLHKLERAKK